MLGSIASVALLALAISATPTEKRDARPSVSLTKKTSLAKNGVVNTRALNSHVASIQSKYARSLATFERNTGSAHPYSRLSNATAAIKRQTGNDPLKDDNSEYWYGKIKVGSQTFTVEFDTGSSDLFLPGPECGSTCSGHTIYTAKDAKDTKETFSLAFGAGSIETTVSGEVFTDSVSVAGLTATGQALGAAKTYSTAFEKPRFPADGLMGMAGPEIAEINVTKPFVNTLISQKAISSGEFGFKLSLSGAVLYLGGVDESTSSGSLNTLLSTHKGYWQVEMDSVDVGGSSAVTSLSAVIDTGTSLIIGDNSTVSEFYRKIPGAKDVGDGYYSFPCDSDPKVALNFGSIDYDISSTFSIGTVSTGSSDCVGGIVANDIPINAWIVGDVFLANVYAEFSIDNWTVGFSKQA